MIHVTKHAARRYQERVEAVGEAAARERILAHSEAFEIAGSFGAPVVRNSDGVRFLVKKDLLRPNCVTVLTVFSPHMKLGPVT